MGFNYPDIGEYEGLQPEPVPYLLALQRNLADAKFAAPMRDAIEFILARVIARERELPSLAADYEGAVRTLCFEQDGNGDGDDLRPALLVALAESVPGWWTGATVAPWRSGERFSIIARFAEAVMAWLLKMEAQGVDRTLELREQLSRAEAALRQGLQRAGAALTDEFRRVGPSGLSSDWMLTADRLTDALKRLFPQDLGIQVRKLEPLPGVNANEVYRAELMSASKKPRPIIIRMNRGGDITGTSLGAEHALLVRLSRAGFAVPTPIAGSDDVSLLGRPFLIMECAPGAARRAEDLAQPKIVVRRAAEFLAELHRAPPMTLGFTPIEGRGPLREYWLQQIDHCYRGWRQARSEPAPQMERAHRWLLDRVENVSDTSCVVHGDFSLRNLLIEDERLACILDWELAHVGHPCEDLVYFRPNAEQLGAWDQFIAVYECGGGSAPGPDQLRFFEIWSAFRNASINAKAQRLFLANPANEIFLGVAGLAGRERIMGQLSTVGERECLPAAERVH